VPEIRRISASEPDYSITPNFTVITNWDIAAVHCRDYVGGQQYGDAVKFLPLAATTAAEAVTNMTGHTLDATKTVNAFLMTVGAAFETWWSQKTTAQMQAVTGATVVKSAYGYCYQAGPDGKVGHWYPVLGRPSSERLAWQLLSILKADAILDGLITTFRHDDYSDFRIPAQHVPILMIVPSSDWEHSGEDVGHHAVDMKVFIGIYQHVRGDHALLGDAEMKIRERITDIILIEDQRLSGYLAEKPPIDPITDAVEKEIEGWREQGTAWYRRMVIPFAAQDKILLTTAGRVY